MAYPFVAAPDHWSRGGVPVKAIVIHMAEGGGTVGWLTRDDGNSSHYVVEYSGRVVQMVQESRAAGSIRASSVRTTDDAPYTYMGERVVYGVTANKAALGSYWRNPNAAVIAIEIEGYAAAGPNAAQREALVELVSDIRSRHGRLPCLGHRDFQSYKRCPGRLISWPALGGHGKAAASPDTGDTVKSFPVYEKPHIATVDDLAWLYDNSALARSDGNQQVSPSRDFVYVGTFSDAVRIVAYEPTGTDANVSSRAMFIRKDDLSNIRPVPDDTAAAVAAAVAKYRAVVDARTSALRAIAVEAQMAAETPPAP